MRKAIFLVAIFSLSRTIWAADPIIGTWKLNIAESTFSSAKSVMFNLAAPSEQTEIYRELSTGEIELTWNNRNRDGSTNLLVETYPVQGGLAKNQIADTPISFVQTRIAQDEWLVTYLLDGKQVATRHKKISKDGKTLRQRIRGFDDEAKPFELLLIFDKQ